MQQQPHLATKLHTPPTRPELVSRPRLLERLNAALPRRGPSPHSGDGFVRSLTLISAPAGFGKTTLLSDWADNLRVGSPQGSHIQNQQSKIANRVAWLSLDEGDNDPARFLSYVVLALQTLGLDADETRRVEGPFLSEGVGHVLSEAEATRTSIGEEALRALGSSQPPPPEAVLTSLINEIAAIPARIILVLDDYHLIEAQPVHEALGFFCEHIPPQMHLAIATREDPQMSLARLRARGLLTELRASDLRFSSPEAAEFLNRAMGLDLSAEDVAALEARTEGWIAGLQLAAISMQGRRDVSSLIRSFTGSHRFVLDYLMEEVLEQQSDSVQAFLLQTSFLDRLTGSLCEAVTGQSNGQANLEMLERANLFIASLDEERRWYRYHQLFADLLQDRLRRAMPGQLSALHGRASEWYERNGFHDEAIAHALWAEDFERAAALIERVAEAVWVRGDDTKLRRWLDRLPGEMMFSRPQLCIFHAWSLFATGQQAAAEPCIQAAEQALETRTDRASESTRAARGPLSGSDETKLRGRLATTRAFFAFYRGDAPAIIRHSRQALECLPEQDLAWRSAATNVLGDAYDFQGEMAAAYQARLAALEVSRAAGNSYQRMIANAKLAIILRQQGWLQRVTEICQQQVQMARERGMSQTVVAGWLRAMWGEVLAELNDLVGAREQASTGVELAERGGEVAMLGSSYLWLTRVLFSGGDMSSAQELVHRMDYAAQEFDMPPWLTNQMATWQARIWLAENKLDAAAQWARERGLDGTGEPTYPQEAEYIVLARLLVAQERPGDATTLLQRLFEAAEAGGRISRVIEILVLEALACQAAGNTAQAMTALERALALSEPGGFVRTFADEGPTMARLLYGAAVRGVRQDHARRLLTAFHGFEEASVTQSKLQSLESAIIEPLSEREIEVLQLIAAGLTNQEIASRLFLTLNTVKAHTRNVYGKLGVHSRTQAVARARAVGILPST